MTSTLYGGESIAVSRGMELMEGYASAALRKNKKRGLAEKEGSRARLEFQQHSPMTCMTPSPDGRSIVGVLGMVAQGLGISTRSVVGMTGQEGNDHALKRTASGIHEFVRMFESGRGSSGGCQRNQR